MVSNRYYVCKKIRRLTILCRVFVVALPKLLLRLRALDVILRLLGCAFKVCWPLFLKKFFARLTRKMYFIHFLFYFFINYFTFCISLCTCFTKHYHSHQTHNQSKRVSRIYQHSAQN